MSNQPSKISVLLATFNGARYLSEQIDSLLAQEKCRAGEIIIRDDGSSDGTRDVIRRYSSSHPRLIRILEPDGRRLGPKRSFATLLTEATGDYVAFCDQDDVWQANKLARQMDAIKAVESTAGIAAPVLCCSDATVVDSTLKVRSGSYFRRHRIAPGEGPQALSRLVFRNYAIGATTMMNRALATACREMPEEAVMHDWWAALVARSIGHTIILPEELILYRQHDGNAVGSRQRRLPRSMAELQAYVDWTRQMSLRAVAQANVLVDLHSASMPRAERNVLERLRSFESQGRLQRMTTLFRTRGFKPGLALNALHVYACLTAGSR